MNEADKQYMERKQKDWEYDEPEHIDPYEFLWQQVKGMIVWLLFGFGVILLVAAVFK